MLVEDPAAWNPLRNALKKLALDAQKPLKYVPNQGNAGDALISAGTWQFFEDCGIDPTYTSPRDVSAGDSLIYAGGGNLVPEYDNCRKFLERCLAVGVQNALVLPHTIRGHEALLAQLDARYTLVCRDLASLDRVRATGTGANVLYGPDLALCIDVTRLSETCARYPKLDLCMGFLRSNKLWNYWRWSRTLERLRPPADGRVEIVRADAEATTRGDPAWDLPNFYGSDYRFRAEADVVSRDMLAYFGQVKKVRTNRLHVGVAGALMGCEVTYFDNSYGKIRAVYDAWLSERPTVRFEGTA